MTSQTFKSAIDQCIFQGDIESFKKHIIPATKAYKIAAMDRLVHCAMRNSEKIPDASVPPALLRYMLLEQGLPLNRLYDAYLPLTVAAGIGDIELAQALVKKGACINPKANKKPSPYKPKPIFTPLMQAAMRHNPQMIDALVELGADPNFAKDQEMPIFWA